MEARPETAQQVGRTQRHGGAVAIGAGLWQHRRPSIHGSGGCAPIDRHGWGPAFDRNRRRTAFDKRLVWWVRDRLDAEAMRKAAKLFAGRHDFRSFCENPEGQESTIVVVGASEIEETPGEIRFRITASHFLWKMVRRLAGTLVEVGRGNLDAAGVSRLLAERSASPAKWTAPPSGLFLERVTYR